MTAITGGGATKSGSGRTRTGGGAANTASGFAHVGVQAGTIHGDVTYVVPPGASAKEIYEIGLNYLNGGMPTKAIELFDEALARGHATAEVWFHWLLALVSDRTLRQFTVTDFAKLRDARGRLPIGDTVDAWARGVRVVVQLLDAVEKPHDDIRLTASEFDTLPGRQRAKIERHLDMFLKGPIEDEMWRREITRVRGVQHNNDRQDRAWKFFQPDPAQPRARPVTPAAITATMQARAAAAAVVFASTAGYLGWLVLAGGRFTAAALYLLAAAAGGLSGSTGLLWRDRALRLRAKERAVQIPRQRAGQPPRDGFADRVDALFDRYDASCGPSGQARRGWSQTEGVRRYLRDEIVEVYRESRIDADEVAWLIRFHLRDTTQRWRAGTLFEYRRQLRTPLIVKAGCVLGLVLLAPTSLLVFIAAVLIAPLPVLAATMLALLSGGIAGSTGLHIMLERRRFAAETLERDTRLRAMDGEFRRWSARLADRPEDPEIAAWLDADRKILMNRAIRHYELKRSAVFAHAFLETPGKTPTEPNKRARARNGPWRYSRYNLIVFLLTPEGVRQFTEELDFCRGEYHNPHRLNYRFDAVAAVRVSETDEHKRTFVLTLVNRQSFKWQVTESSTARLRQDEDPTTLSKVALDASGLTHTLHVLEGVAAEGKEWINRETQRKHTWHTDFSAALQDLLAGR